MYFFLPLSTTKIFVYMYNKQRRLCKVEKIKNYAEERKEELIPFETARMELENIMLSEISQSVKDKYL